MPSHPLSYNVHTPQQSQKGKKWMQRKSGGKKPKAGLVGSIIATYMIVAGVIGFAMFSGFRDQSQASSESAFVSASLRLTNEEEEYKVGSQVETSLTIQNTSITDPINNLNIEFNSTNSAVHWDSAMLTSSTTQKRELTPSGNTFIIPLLAAGERVEYDVTGTLTESEFDFLTLVAQLTFENREGPQSASTNRVFTKLQDITGSGKLLALEPAKESFSKDEKVKLKLSYQSKIEVGDPLAPQIKGKIYLTQKETKNVAVGLDCQLGNRNECEASVEKLDPGNYTALFIDEKEQVFSRIAEFKITGESGSFTPSNLSILELPFDSQSVNGIVPVIAKKVIGLNDTPSGEKCIFEVIRDKKVVSKVEAPVESDRTCYTTLDSSHISKGAGTYTVKLAGSSKSANVLFSPKSSDLIPLENQTQIMKTGNSVQVSASNIEDLDFDEDDDEAESNLLAQAKATLGIWHPRSGNYKEITNFGGSPIEVTDGQLNVNIPGEEFSKGGFYSVYLKLEDGRYTDFLGLSFDDEEVAFSQSGVLVEDINKLRVGEDVNFRLENVVDRSGNKINQAECAINLYESTSGPIPETAKGEIKDGTCKVTVPAGKVKKSGPVLISFTGDNIANRVNQSRQFYFAPSSPKDYGFFGLEYEPAKANYANNIIIGPVTDLYGNTTNAFGHKVQIFDISPQIVPVEEEVVTEEENPEEGAASEVVEEIPAEEGVLPEEEIPVEPVLIGEYSTNIEDGFAKVTAPSSLFNVSQLKIVLLNDTDKVIREREIDITVNDEKLILPNFPGEIQSDEKIQFGLSDVDPEVVEECKLFYFRSEKEFAETKVETNPETRNCTFDWGLNQFRDNSQALIQVQAGDKLYSHIVQHLNGQANTLFVTSPQLRINERDEIEIELLTSPIVDINGRPVDTGDIRWEYNGKTEKSRIENGFAKLSLTADKISNQDLRSVLDQRYLELSLDARASVTAINRTNSMSVYLGTKGISNTRESFAIQSASTRIHITDREIFEFQTEACNASILSDQSSQKNVRTHWQGGTCYVEVNGNLGDHRILFEENGFTLGRFDYTVSEEKAQVIWCDQNPCEVQLITQNRGEIEATIYDEDKQYKFETDSIDNIILLEQNGLNPLKEYLVELRFEEEGGETVSVYRMIPGEHLQQQKKSEI